MLSSGVKIDFRYFLDRAAVVDHVGKTKVKALKKAGYAIMQHARRSITKQGMAKGQLRVAKENPNIRLSELVNSPTISKRDRKSVVRRLQEVRNKKHSDPGQPPFTHTGMFRNHIVFAWDPGSESVVVGQAMPKGDWLAKLHEFGGSERVQGFVLVPKYPRYKSPIIRFVQAGMKPKDSSRWQPAPRLTDTFNYPPRPYMRPALAKKIADGTVVNSFRIGGN